MRITQVSDGQEIGSIELEEGEGVLFDSKTGEFRKLTPEENAELHIEHELAPLTTMSAGGYPFPASLNGSNTEIVR